MFKKLLAIIILLILVLSSMIVIYDPDNNEKIIRDNDLSYNNTGNNSTSLISYIPSNYQGYVNYELKSYNIKYNYSGNLLNINYNSNNEDFLNTFFNSLNKTLGITFFTSNNSNYFVPYISESYNYNGAYLPSNIYDAYDINYVHNEGYCGNNVTIVIVDAYGDPSIRYDASVFDNLTNTPTINLTIDYPEGIPTKTNSGWATETAVDVEMSHAIAPAAKIKLLVTPGSGNTLIDGVSYAISHNLGNIISLSWGSPESEVSNGELSTLNKLYRQAAEENITVLGASGDQGAYDGTSSLTTNFPASDPYVLGVGGTTLTYSNGKYTQTAWGSVINGKEEGSGGGFSHYFKRPYYQDPYDYSGNYYGVPEVSLDANPNTGVLVVVSGETYKLGGTSIATPMWAGIIAIMDNYFHRSLGFINPLFYQISRTKYYTSAFTQITSGNNDYYYATPGWNAVTGLGTPLVSNLINATAEILDGYGSVLLFNGTYYANEISAEINVPSNNSEQFNGTTYYYISFYINNNNFIKFGISDNITGYYYKYIIEENGVKTVYYENGKNNSYLTIHLNNKINFEVGNITKKSVNMPAAFSGNYRAGVGAQQYNSQINFVNIPDTVYSNINIYYNSTKININNNSIYEEHYNNIESNYSKLNFNYNESDNIITAIYSANYTNGFIYKTNQTGKIVYSITEFVPKVSIKLSISNSSKAIYYINGSKINAVSDITVDHTFSHGGYYNITADVSGNNISREIYIPDINGYTINFTYMPSGYKAELNVTIDNYFTYNTDSKTLNVYELAGANSIKVSSKGYKIYNGNIIGNKTITMTEKNVLVTIFVFTGNVSTTINNNKTLINGGYNYLYVNPGNITINVTEPGYINYSRTIYLNPGNDYNSSVQLKPVKHMNIINGTVYNKQYDYTLSNVRIFDKNGTLGYTNSTGNFSIYIGNGTYNTTFSEYLYKNYSKNISKTDNPIGIYMLPKSVVVTIINFNILHYIPIAFYFVYVSWNEYTLSNFGLYKVYYSTNQFMENPKSVTIYNQGTTYTVLSGLTPGKTYYITVTAYSANGSFISTQQISVYYNPVYYVLNGILIGGILAYIGFMIKFFVKRKKKDDDFNF